MPFEDVMSTLLHWLVATEALAAVGAELTLLRSAEAPHDDVIGAMRRVSAAAGLPDLDELSAPQRDTVIGLIRMTLRQAIDLVDQPEREPGWTFTDPDILRGCGHASALVPHALVAEVPALAGVRSFLDVGSGVGGLAIAAASVWQEATIVGIDTWGPSLDVSRANIRAAGLEQRITIRDQDVMMVDDVEAYDCVWFPTIFVTEPVFTAAMPRLFTALRHSGWLVLARMASPPDPLAEATTALRIMRSGGTDFDTKHLSAALEDVGCVDVRVLPRRPASPMEYVIGKRCTN
jgi:protein-L-isoaspartate O-methyltransferase